MKQKDFNLKFAETIRSNSSEDILVSYLKDSRKLSAKRALEVYQEDYQARMTEALRNTYAAIHSLIGDEDFFHLAQDYIKKYPSPFSDLDDYGNYLSEFLSTHPLNIDYIFLSELAHFEWNFKEVFHLNDEKGLDALELQNILQDNSTKVQLIGSAKILNYSFTIDKLYSLKETNENDEEEFNFEQEQYLLIHKSGVMVKIHALSKNQWEIMKKFQTPTALLSALQNAPATVTPDEIQNLFLILGTDRILLKSN